MPVVSLVVELRLAGCGTARQRAQLLEAILGKLRSHFNLSAVDLGLAAPEATEALGFAAVARTRREAREVLERAADAVAAHPRVEVLKVAFDEL